MLFWLNHKSIICETLNPSPPDFLFKPVNKCKQTMNVLLNPDQVVEELKVSKMNVDQNCTKQKIATICYKIGCCAFVF